MNENRYILASFAGRSQQIVPDFLKGRDIVDLEEDEKFEYRELFSKLAGVPKYEFSPVAPEKTTPSPNKIGAFQSVKMTDLSSELNLDFTKKGPMSDLEKKKFLKKSFESIVESLKRISDEFCSQTQYFQIEFEEIDSVTTVFDIYKNEKKLHSIQIWFGNMMGSRDNSIFVGNSIGSKNSYSQMISYKDVNGIPMLYFTLGMFLRQNEGTVEEVVKQIWEDSFQSYLRRE